MTKGFVKYLFITALIIAQAIAVHVVWAGEHRQHGTHEHGIARMNVAVEGHNVVIELLSPAVNFLGFEHHPRTKVQKDQVAEARNKLENGQALFELPAQAQIRLIRSKVNTDIDGDSTHAFDAHHAHEQTGVDNEDENTGHDLHNDGHVHERHSDFKAEYHFVCDKPAKLAYLDVMLLHIFPGIERIEVQILTDTGQTAKELTTIDYRITF